MGEPHERPMRRRDFLGLTALGAFVMAIITSFLGAMRLIVPQVFAELPRSYKIGEPGGFPAGEIRIPPGRSVYVFHEHNGVLCHFCQITHLGCAVPWVEAEGQFHCPCHGSLYDRHGVVVDGPAPRPLDTFPVSLKNDEIWVDTSKPTERSKFDPSQ